MSCLPHQNPDAHHFFLVNLRPHLLLITSLPPNLRKICVVKNLKIENTSGQSHITKVTLSFPKLF